MKIGDLLFFAPGVPFKMLNIDSSDIVDKFRARIEAYYLVPAHLMVKHEEAFAATVLLVSCMDAISYYAPACAQYKKHGDRYIGWLQTELPDLFPDKNVATQFYQDIRCGSVHEGRIKNGCVFDFVPYRSISVEDGVMAVNPKRLIEPVANALDRFCKATVADAHRLAKFKQKLKKDFQIELR